MCGIAGFAGKGTAGAVQAMCDCLVHRGPDDAGLVAMHGAELGNRRLSIVDPEGGHQPLANEDRTVWLTFNGEIYNYPALRTQLSREGHRFETRTDTEAVAHAYESHGDDCLHLLNGMFAFALWDDKERRLLAARDRLGIKPLYYAELEGGALAFASELKALLKYPGISRDLDLVALDQYLRLQYIPAPRTIFTAVRKLPAGHRLIWQNGVTRIESYWTPRFEADEGVSEAEWLKCLRERLTESVRMQLMSDVPLGAFLSGGVDSTAVVASMSRLVGRPVQTFTIGFADARYDESSFAQAVARELGTDHHALIVPPGIEEDLFTELVAQLDEPFADPSFIPTYHLSKLARQHVKVVLSGDGGDETFAGYRKYRQTATWQNHWGAAATALRPFQRLIRSGASHLPAGRRTAILLGLDGTGQFAELAYGYYSFRARELYAPAMRQALADAGEQDFWSGIAEAVEGEEKVSQAQHADLLTYLPEDILMKVDKMSMAVSLEARVPLLDHELQELAMRVPASLKLHNHTSKYIFKRMLRGLVPGLALDRPKIGFTPTLSYWLRDDWPRVAAHAAGTGYGVKSGLFCKQGVERLPARGDLVHLWSLWVFEKWAQAYLA
jgi:asparagine synthase (glutamine-hydrolysing)